MEICCEKLHKSKPILSGGRAQQSLQTVYIGNNDYKLYAFDTETGQIKWTYFTTGQIFQSPVIGTIYISSENDAPGNEGANGDFYALNADGTLKWKSVTSTKKEGVPAGCALVLEDETVIDHWWVAVYGLGL